jgi:hypothetical protein
VRASNQCVLATLGQALHPVFLNCFEHVKARIAGWPVRSPDQGLVDQCRKADQGNPGF